MALHKTVEQELQRLLNGGKGPLNRDKFEKSQPKNNNDKDDPPKNGGTKKRTPQGDLLAIAKQKAKQGYNNIKNFAKSEYDYYKDHPVQLGINAGSLVLGGIPGAITNGVTGYNDFKRNGYDTKAALMGGTATGAGGFLLGKAGGKIAEKAVGKLIKPKPQYAYATARTPQNAIKNIVQEPPKGSNTYHGIIADRLKAQHPDDWPNQIARRDLKTGKETLHDLDRTKMKYNPKGKEMSTKEMFDYRENTLKQKMADDGYDMTPGGKWVDEDGKLTDNAWLEPVADLHVPYLYDTENYLHVAPNKIEKGRPFDPDLRGRQEAFWDTRGGDLGEGAYGTAIPDLRKPSPNDVESVLDYNINTYNRMHPLAYANEFKAPKRDYMIAGELSYGQQNPNMRWLLNQALKHRGESIDNIKNFPEMQHGLETIYDPMNINTILDRRYGIPGDTGLGQTAIGNESLNTQIFNNRRFKVPERGKQMAEQNYLDPTTGMIYNGVTKKPQLTYPSNKPLFMDSEEMDYLKSLGIKDVSEMPKEKVDLAGKYKVNN